jgi:hypothetical protein
LCKEIIDECNIRQWKKHRWNNYSIGNTTYSKITKELDVMDSTEEQHNKIVPFLIQELKEYQKVCSWDDEASIDEKGNQWISRLTPIRFNKYEVGTLMRRHIDHIHSIFDGELKGIPIVSMVGCLNEDYEGSKFICRKKEIKLETGDLLMFPSNFMYPHEVTECTKGTRYSFVGWAF